jgi:hypothetical protein
MNAAALMVGLSENKIAQDGSIYLGGLLRGPAASLLGRPPARRASP